MTPGENHRKRIDTRTEYLNIIPDIETGGFDLPVQYAPSEPMVFFGHYSLDPVSQHPVQAPNAICLDFSAPRDPPITAYAWNGRQEFRVESMVQV